MRWGEPATRIRVAGRPDPSCEARSHLSREIERAAAVKTDPAKE